MDILYGDGVDAGERFVEQDELGVDRHRARDFGSASFAARKLDTHTLAHFLQPELLDQVFEPFALVLLGKIGHLQHGPDIVFH